MLSKIEDQPYQKIFCKNLHSRVRKPNISYKKLRHKSKKAKKSVKEIELQNKLDALNVSLNQVHSELEKYIYRASHDLRAPLVSVLGLINVIKLTDKEKPTTQYLNMMEGTIQKLDYTIREIVYNASISRRVIQPEIIDLEEVLNQAIQHQKTNNAGCHVNSIISIDQNEAFRSDIDLVTLIVHHLIANAFRFRNLMTERLILRIEVKSRNNNMIMEVSDNGRGIKEDKLPQIFNMFNRSSSEIAGLGLGLYTVQEAVKKLNGLLTVKSTENQGTTVTVKLPFMCI